MEISHRTIQHELQYERDMEKRMGSFKTGRKNYLKEPTNKPPGHNLPRKEWATLNRIRTGHGRCGYLMHKWNVVPTPNCECGNPYQTILHILTECPIRKFNGEPEDMFNASPEAIEWIQNLDIKL